MAGKVACGQEDAVDTDNDSQPTGPLSPLVDLFSSSLMLCGEKAVGYLPPGGRVDLLRCLEPIRDGSLLSRFSRGAELYGTDAGLQASMPELSAWVLVGCAPVTYPWTAHPLTDQARAVCRTMTDMELLNVDRQHFEALVGSVDEGAEDSEEDELAPDAPIVRGEGSQQIKTFRDGGVKVLPDGSSFVVGLCESREAAGLYGPEGEPKWFALQEQGSVFGSHQALADGVRLLIAIWSTPKDYFRNHIVAFTLGGEKVGETRAPFGRWPHNPFGHCFFKAVRGSLLICHFCDDENSLEVWTPGTANEGWGDGARGCKILGHKDEEPLGVLDAVMEEPANGWWRVVTKGVHGSPLVAVLTVWRVHVQSGECREVVCHRLEGVTCLAKNGEGTYVCSLLGKGRAQVIALTYGYTRYFCPNRRVHRDLAKCGHSADLMKLPVPCYEDNFHQQGRLLQE